MKMKFLDNKARKLFAMPTFEKLGQMVERCDESLMTDEEFESEEQLRRRLWLRLVDYMENKGLYDRKKNARSISIAIILQRRFALLSSMKCKECCSQCQHLKDDYNELLTDYEGVLSELGILSAPSGDSNVPSTK